MKSGVYKSICGPAMWERAPWEFLWLDLRSVWSHIHTADSFFMLEYFEGLTVWIVLE